MEERRRRKVKRRRIKRRSSSYLPEVEPIPPDPAVVKAKLSGLAEIWGIPCICLLLAIFVFIVFGQTLKHDFVNYDDANWVAENPVVTGGLLGIVKAFFHTVDGFYVPLTVVSHVMDYSIYQNWAGGHHLTNLLLHVTATLLLFFVLRRMTSQLWLSLLVTVLFAIHPLQAETVSWISQRKEVLGGLLFVLTLGSYVRYVTAPPAAPRFFAVILLFAGGLLCSPALAALPFVLLLLDYWPLGRLAQWVQVDDHYEFLETEGFVASLTRLVFEKIPLFALSAIFVIVTYVLQRKADSENLFSLPARIINSIVAWVIYLKRTLLPSGLTVFYPDSAVRRPFFTCLIAIAVLAAIGIIVLLLRKRRPYLLVGFFWYLGMLVPLALMFPGRHFTETDHFTYLPLIGLFLMIAWTLGDLVFLLQVRKPITAPFVTPAVSSLAILAVILLMIRAHDQGATWQDSESLWRNAAENTTGNYIAHHNLGVILFKNEKIDEAMEQYQQALKIRPDHAGSEYNLALAFAQKGKMDEAIAHYRNALQIQPDYIEPRINLGMALFQSGSQEEAIIQYRKALEIDPKSSEAHLNLGMALGQKQDIDGAIAEYRRALEINPRSAEAEYNAGVAYSQKGDWTEAAAHYRNALAIRPAYAEAGYNLGIALFQSGDLDGAIETWRRTLRYKPKYEEVYYNLGIALSQKGNNGEAIESYRKALEIGPHYAETYTNMGNAFLQRRQPADAIAAFQKAMEIAPQYLLPQSNLAWLLATCPNAKFRDGKKALELALKINQAAGEKNPMLLRTLAAAYAETGQFPEAVRTAEKALSLSKADKDNADMTAGITQELLLYQSGKPYHETP